MATKEQIIEHGLGYLGDVGIEAVCQVCVPNGGSCCKSCSYLRDRVGCQSRNTSCTAWLCGFQKYIFFELGLLEAWNLFWEQVPGQDYRQDFTPTQVVVPLWLDKPDPRIRSIVDAFARDLEELRIHKKIMISQFNDTLESYMINNLLYPDSEIARHVLKKQRNHMLDFKQFRMEKENYYSR
ncbi:hypothetical protein [Paenibacillus radicis (ex Xue et al. 2023)]|uniref:DNA mismatch repair protein n=1 Tax=Paenibacillus radicis (ex Xue et al. 2023) TaxID=2972489 RepID=A0ABT1YQJ1_9BACL|nr:hypothetical protein [Paenibacillus radicis (ex Xue et al. 2023)]MCR8635449.1 hypothetical protein [Paenibacillus radicis (ex Xue et al. 2023)]